MNPQPSKGSTVKRRLKGLVQEIYERSLARLLLYAALIATLCCLTPVSTVRGDIYGFKDDKGVWHFTNIPSDPRYRLYMKASGLKAKPYIVKYDEIITRASRQFDVDPHLIKAIIKAESSFRPNAVSNSGAKGLMQLMPATAMDMKVNDPFDPEENILGGTKYFSLLLKRFKRDTRLAVAAYNVGATTVDTYNGVPPFPQTKRFVERVFQYYQEFKKSKD
jgi:soluble lytic murein transglycosylase-like protein